MEYKLKKKEIIAPEIYDLIFEAPQIAQHAKAGQFVIIRVDEKGERIPLTIAQTSEKHIRLIVQVVGKSTEKLSKVPEGGRVIDITGPLGNPSEIDNYGNVLIIGGGVGIAAILPIVKALYEAGNETTVIIGARSKKFLILKEEISEYSHNLIVTTDDGSYGMKGFVTDAFKTLINKGKNFKVAWAVGPTIMMENCSKVAKEIDIPIWTSLNPIMVDGTGMCGGCRVEVNGEIKFACVDGPEFDGRYVNWDDLRKRLQQYRDLEIMARKSKDVKGDML
ncbi:MAG: sulfide/dihydroorotate dehydrogenase-like FAD/NAD-binding protein [Thermotogae bacterium]|nr:sulfide/dihydroorotate dehydrogenase-like FAD/NAD-binding protein [Thermotogota bacterium]